LSYLAALICLTVSFRMLGLFCTVTNLLADLPYEFERFLVSIESPPAASTETWPLRDGTDIFLVPLYS
jgi:hypothetical protein